LTALPAGSVFCAGPSTSSVFCAGPSTSSVFCGTRPPAVRSIDDAVHSDHAVRSDHDRWFEHAAARDDWLRPGPAKLCFPLAMPPPVATIESRHLRTAMIPSITADVQPD
jgi:hypothetical protein